MMRDNELLTPLVTDSLEGSKAVTRSALQRGVHQVRVYHRSVPLTAQQREGRGNQTGVERYSKLGDVTYFIHYKDIQGTIREKRYREAIHDQSATQPAVKFFTYHNKGRREVVRHVPLRTREYEPKGIKRKLNSYYRVEKYPPNPHDVLDKTDHKITEGDDDKDGVVVITRSQSLIQFNQTSNTALVVTDIREIRDNMSSSCRASPALTTADESMFYKFHNSDLRRGPNFIPISEDKPLTAYRHMKLLVSHSDRNKQSRKLQNMGLTGSRSDTTLLISPQCQDNCEIHTESHCVDNSDLLKPRYSKSLPDIKSNPSTYRLINDRLHTKSLLVQSMDRRFVCRTVKQLLPHKTSATIHLIAQRGDMKYLDCCRGDMEITHERRMKNFLLRGFLESYFCTEAVKLTSISNTRTLLKTLSSEGRLCIHPVSNAKRLSRTQAILCVDLDTAGLLRHDRLYLYWQICNLIQTSEESLLVTVSDNPLTLIQGAVTAGTPKPHLSLLRRIQQFAT